jgi:GrpB-like predicted nucleotidyltransferase (UPF0157 family)
MSEQTPRVYRARATEEQIRAAHVGDLTPLSGRILIVDYDPDWPKLFRREAQRVNAALGERALRIEHAGSTAVPGLAAKPIIDMVLEVADSADEKAYVPPLEDAGYVLRIREPHWYQHRTLRARSDAQGRVGLMPPTAGRMKNHITAATIPAKVSIANSVRPVTSLRS